MEFDAVDLFCGAGGLSGGLERAGWNTVAAVDFDRDSIQTLTDTRNREISVGGDGQRTYFDGSKILQADIAKVRAADLRPPGRSRRWSPTLLAGGPPCQPFSSAGKQRGFHDARGNLFAEFVRLADELRPRFLMLENVRGLVTARGHDGSPGEALRHIQTCFESIGYACRFVLLNAADFGGAQRRVRLFMLASAEYELPVFPEPTHANEPKESTLFGLAPWVTLKEAIESVVHDETDEFVLPSARLDGELRALRPGTGLRAQGIVEANRPGGHWGYRQDSFVADLSVPSRTIRAASTPDWIFASDGTLRRLTWRECAALQGFDSEWRFFGGKASRFRQIGNAVEGNVATAVGAALLRHAKSARRSVPTSPEWPSYFNRRVQYVRQEEIVNGAHRSRARSATKL